MGLIYSFCFLLLLLFVFKLISDYLFLDLYKKLFPCACIFNANGRRARMPGDWFKILPFDK